MYDFLNNVDMGLWSFLTIRPAGKECGGSEWRDHGLRVLLQPMGQVSQERGSSEVPTSSLPGVL